MGDAKIKKNAGPEVTVTSPPPNVTKVTSPNKLTVSLSVRLRWLRPLQAVWVVQEDLDEATSCGIASFARMIICGVPLLVRSRPSLLIIT